MFMKGIIRTIVSDVMFSECQDVVSCSLSLDIKLRLMSGIAEKGNDTFVSHLLVEALMWSLGQRVIRV